MAKKIKVLSPRSISTLLDGFHKDGGNLYLRVRGDSRSWVFRYKKGRDGKQISIALGVTHTRSLASAREIAARMRTAIADGKEPLDELAKKFNPTARTFADYANEYIENNKPSWRNAKHIKQWQSTLVQYVYPRIGGKLPADVTLHDIKEILLPIWTTKTETASRVRMRIEAALDYAAVMENTSRYNPARWKGNLDKLFPAPRKVTKRVHFAAAPYTDVPRIMSELRMKNSLSAYVLRFTILTAARSMEVRGARWEEIDMTNKVWTIQASRMKAGRIHAVPLVDEAIEILTHMKELKFSGSELVFQGERGGVLSDVAINKTLHAIASNCTVHGFRSSFRVYAAEITSSPSIVAEIALAHVNKDKTESAYQRSDLFELRKKLMIRWGKFCCSSNNVLQFKGKIAS